VDARTGGRLDVAVRVDQELRLHGSREVGFRQELLLVAVLDLLDVALDVAADDRLVEIARHVGLPDRHRGNAGPPTAHATVGGAVAPAGTDGPVTSGADRSPAGGVAIVA